MKSLSADGNPIIEDSKQSFAALVAVELRMSSTFEVSRRMQRTRRDYRPG